MLTDRDLISIGIIRRTHYKDLPDFVFVLREGLFVPFRKENISELIGEEGFVLRTDMQGEEDEMAWTDFEGYTLVDGNQKVGVIATVDDTTMNIFAELEDGRLVPLNEHFIVSIDEQAKVLNVQFPFAL